jgi:cell division protein ZapE
MSMTPLQAYQQQILQKTLQVDSEQALAMQALQQIYDELLIRKKWLATNVTGKGLYLWGPVGSGKTYLMDLFYQHLTLPKSRYHFHQFMHHIQVELSQRQGESNPLARIAKRLSKEVNIICLDEFLVHEIGDAMRLAQLLSALFQHGLILVTTANTAPDDLYRNGLQRDRFLPAIALIKKNLRILHLKCHTDYRRYSSTGVEDTYPFFIMSTQEVQGLFDKLSQKERVSYQAITINGRLITHLGCTHRVIWFDFSSICSVPRSQIDYLVIAKQFSTILISDLQCIGEDDDNLARLFIHLIDILYDAGCTLILSARIPIVDIYPKGRFMFEFQRIKSRLASFKQTGRTITTYLG